MGTHADQRKAFELALDAAETIENVSGEMEVRFSDGQVMLAKFCGVSEAQWEEVDAKKKGGLWAVLFGRKSGVKK